MPPLPYLLLLVLPICSYAATSVVREAKHVTSVSDLFLEREKIEIVIKREKDSSVDRVMSKSEGKEWIKMQHQVLAEAD